MQSNKTNPQLVQNRAEMASPIRQRTKAIRVLFTCAKVLVSWRTVATASTIEKAESTPSKNKVRPSKKHQKADPSILRVATG